MLAGSFLVTIRLSSCSVPAHTAQRKQHQEGMVHPQGASSDNVDDFKQIFALYDRDGDGNVPLREFQSVVRACGRMPTDAELNALISQLPHQSNGQSSFTFSDLLNVLGSLPRPDPAVLRQQLLAAFRVFDETGEGTLRATELHHILTSLGERLEDKEAEEMCRLGDLNGDGLIVYETLVDKLIQ